MVNNWFNIIQDSLFPPTCILCGASGFDSQDLCLPCFNTLQRITHCCYQCAEIFETANPDSQLCGRCINKTPAFDRTYAPFVYQGIIRYLIATLKFNKQYKNARLLGYLLANYLNDSAEMPDIILPVPLHKKRYRERGFNQSIEIAKIVSRKLSVPIDTKSCIRIRNTSQQTKLSAKKRHQNIKNAFEIRKPITAQHIAILDDVMTTGSTASELAKILKRSGVIRVDVWVCARA